MHNYTLLNVQASRAVSPSPGEVEPRAGACLGGWGPGAGCPPLLDSASSEPGAPRVRLIDELHARSN